MRKPSGTWSETYYVSDILDLTELAALAARSQATTREYTPC